MIIGAAELYVANWQVLRGLENYNDPQKVFFIPRLRGEG
jgi:hypothetical protein